MASISLTQAPDLTLPCPCPACQQMSSGWPLPTEEVIQAAPLDKQSCLGLPSLHSLSGGRFPSWLAPDLNQRITELGCGGLGIFNEQMWKLRPETTGLRNGQNDFGNQTSQIQHPFIQNIPCRKPAPCHMLWVPGNTKIHNIIVPEAGEKDQHRKLQYGQVSTYEGSAVWAQTIPDSLWPKKVPLELSRRKNFTGQVRGTEGATFW